MTPIPTLALNMSDLFTQTNSWMGTFSPIVNFALGAGLAITLLLFVGALILRVIKNALGSAGKAS